MTDITTYGLDLAKRKFHVVAINSVGKKILAVKLEREEVLPYFASRPTHEALVAMEACGGCHHWYEKITELGFSCKLLKPIDVKAYAKSKQKNDQNDALAIAKAARDPELKPVTPKNQKTRQIMLLHKIRSKVIRERVGKSNGLMGILLEYDYDAKVAPGSFAKKAREHVQRAFSMGCINAFILGLLLEDAEEIEALFTKEERLNRTIIAQNQESARACQMQTIIGVGPINASILSVLPIESYETPRDFAASLGLVPSQHSTGGRTRLGGITKRGDRYARTMLIQGARTVVMQARQQLKKAQQGELKITDKLVCWAAKLLARTESFNKVCVAVANKMARIAHAMAMHGTLYERHS